MRSLVLAKGKEEYLSFQPKFLPVVTGRKVCQRTIEVAMDNINRFTF